MAFLDKFKGKAAEAVDKHGDKISGGLDKAGQFVDKKTKGKYSDKIATGKGKIGEGMNKLDKSPDITSSGTTATAGGTIDPDAGTSGPIDPDAGTSEPINPAAGTSTSSPLAPQPTSPTSVPSSDSAAPVSAPRPGYDSDSEDDSTLPPSAPPYPPAP